MDLIKTLTEKVNVSKALGKLIDKLNCLEWTIPYTLVVDNLPECDFKYILKLSKVKTVTLTLFHAPRICAIPVELANGLGLTTYIEVKCDNVPVIPKYHNFLRENLYEVIGDKARKRVDTTKLDIIRNRGVAGYSQADVVGFIIAASYIPNYNNISVETFNDSATIVEIELHVKENVGISRQHYLIAPITAEFYEKYSEELVQHFKECLDSYKPQYLDERLTRELFENCQNTEDVSRAKLVEFNGAFAAVYCSTDFEVYSHDD